MALLDFRPLIDQFPQLVHKSDYRQAQQVSARLHREGHPSLVAGCARETGGENCAILNPAVLSNPRSPYQLMYRLGEGRVVVPKQPGLTWMENTV